MTHSSSSSSSSASMSSLALSALVQDAPRAKDTSPSSSASSLDLPLYPADILLPTEGVKKEWCVIAADQFTSSAEYWAKVENEVRTENSTLRLILPELYLQTESAEKLAQRVADVHQKMREYFVSEVFKCHQNAVIYVERETKYTECRKSLILALDLESYTYCDDTARNVDVRASEATVLERIPPREKVRAGAILELPHVQVLFDDPADSVFSEISNAQWQDALPVNSLNVASLQLRESTPLYETELMLDGGKITAWEISGESRLWEKVAKLLAKTGDSSREFRFIVGDGNHSLAAAKSHWEKLKTAGASSDDPARYALVEIINVHDRRLRMEPIHRLLRGVGIADLKKEADRWNEMQIMAFPESAELSYEEVTLLGGSGREKISFVKSSELLVEAVQKVIDNLISRLSLEPAWACEYVHGVEELNRLVEENEGIGILLPALDRSALFDYVAVRGVMPRKSFSLGEAEEKRYYCECRKIIN